VRAEREGHAPPGHAGAARARRRSLYTRGRGGLPRQARYWPPARQAHSAAAALPAPLMQDAILSDWAKFRQRQQAMPSQEAQADAAHAQEHPGAPACCSGCCGCDADGMHTCAGR